MKKNYKLYSMFIWKGILGIIRLTIVYILRAIIRLIMWVVNGIKQHKLRTAVICCFAMSILNVWQLVYYKTERLKVEQRCDSLYTKSLETKTWYDRGYQDGLRFNYNFK